MNLVVLKEAFDVIRNEGIQLVPVPNLIYEHLIKS